MCKFRIEEVLVYEISLFSYVLKRVIFFKSKAYRQPVCSFFTHAGATETHKKHNL
jgi:hypothetical protein